MKLYRIAFIDSFGEAANGSGSKYRNKWLRDIQVTQVTDNLTELAESERCSERCEAEAHNANNKKKGDEKMKGITITLRSGSKTLTREVYVKVDNNRGVLCGYVGRCAFYWDPNKHDLPYIKLTKEDERKLFLSCMSSQERHKKYQRMRELVKAFLCAYKKNTVPDKIPDGFEPVSESFEELQSVMFQGRL